MTYKVENWQNHNRLLTRTELDEIRGRMSGIHFSKEAHDEVAIQMLYCAEALMRECDMLIKDIDRLNKIGS